MNETIFNEEQRQKAAALFGKLERQIWNKLSMGAVLDYNQRVDFSIKDQSDLTVARQFLEWAKSESGLKNIERNFAFFVEEQRHPGCQIGDISEVIAISIAVKFFIDPLAKIIVAFNPDRGSWDGTRDAKELVIFEISERYPEGFIISLKPREYLDYIALVESSSGN